MKTPVKTFALVAFLSLAAGAAQAAERSCPLDVPAPSARQALPIDMSKIEAALQAGQITPYEAGRLMRQQWEFAQFQRGFLGAAPQPEAGKGGGCGLASGDSGRSGDLGDMAGKVAGSVAKNGIQTATKVMRALMREGERLINDQKAEDGVAF